MSRPRRGPYRPPRTPTLYDKDEWRKWPDASVKLRRVPKDVTTQDLHANFSAYGHIVYIEVYQSHQASLFGQACVRFEPPPSQDFWRAGKLLLIRGDGNNLNSSEVSIELSRPQGNFDGTIRSKVNPAVFYPAKFRLNVGTLEFGPGRMGPDMMVKKQIISSIAADDPIQLIMIADFNRRQLSIFFALPIIPSTANKSGSEKRRREFKIQIEFRQLKDLTLRKGKDSEETSSCLTIPLDNPPAYYQRDESILKHTFNPDRLVWADSDQWIRTTHIFDNYGIVQDFSVGLLTDWQDPSFIDIGRWTTLRLHIQEDPEVIENFLCALHDLNIETRPQAKGREHEVLPCLLPSENRPRRNTRQHRYKVDVAQDVHGLSLLEDHAPTVSPLPFTVQYQLEVCLSRGILSEFLLSRQFIGRLRTMGSTRAQYLLEYLADRGKRVRNSMAAVECEEARSYYPQLIVPRYCATIRKVLVTPTTLVYNAPSVEASNRILRQFSHLQDRFLRVQFIDELHLGRIKSLNSMEQDHYLFRRVFHTLINGIQIGDRHFKFLAFGNSQIRECGAYFFSETGDVTCKSIRAWMGNFEHIRVVAKCAARIGQCFSTTRQIQGFRTPQVTRIDDIERNGYCFTDGVGKISAFLAQVIVQEMGIDTRDAPSAFQFRMGGCKGVLAVWPDVRMTEIQIRKSQEKFTSRFNDLEVIRAAQFSMASLNRQTITILSSLGVPRKAFLDLADVQIAEYKNAMSNRTAAATLLGIYIDENQTSLALRDLINWGFMDPEIQEPFVMTILQLWRTWSMKQLKEKARVVVEKGAFVLGCVDETGSLRGHSCATAKSGSKNADKLPQIFLQIPSTSSSTGYSPVTGICLVGRNPSLHPGDIRMVQAVDCLPLRHLRNVAVFPSVGDRDVPGMLSGGDLDGDDFFVIWEPSLIPRQWDYPPMDYRAPPPEALNRDIHHQDLAQFFVKYVRNDCLPIIALSHLANADDSAEGAKSKTCLKLAALHSKAVDFVKTGDPAILTKDLRARRWPHFMERDRNSYHSSSALGQIYDRVGKVEFSPSYQNNFDKRILNKFSMNDDMLKRVRQIKTQYDTAIRRLMAQREIQTEFEIWTGFVLTRPRVGSGYKLTEDIGRESSIIKQHYRHEIQKAAGGSHMDTLGPWVASMYKITAEEMMIALHCRGRGPMRPKGSTATKTTPQAMAGMPLISFPWIFHEQLGHIATGQWAKKIHVHTDTAADDLPIREWEGEGNDNLATQYFSASHGATETSKKDIESAHIAGVEPTAVNTALHTENEKHEASSDTDTLRTTRSNDQDPLEHPEAVYLPDGRILHRGEVLHIFSDESDEWLAPVHETGISSTPVFPTLENLGVASLEPESDDSGPLNQASPVDDTRMTGPNEVVHDATATYREHMAEIEATQHNTSESAQLQTHDPFAAIFHLARNAAALKRETPTKTATKEGEEPALGYHVGVRPESNGMTDASLKPNASPTSSPNSLEPTNASEALASTVRETEPNTACRDSNLEDDGDIYSRFDQIMD